MTGSDTTPEASIDYRQRFVATTTAESWTGPMPRIRSCGMTDIGCKRQRNEDCFGLDNDRRLYVVADGIGGSCHGDVASRIAVDGIHHHIVEYPQSLELAIHGAHVDLCQAAEEDESLQGMGTTVVGLHFDDHQRATVAHIGDSRAYRLREGQLELLTRDHTLADHFAADGKLEPEEVAAHPLSHVLTRALSLDQAPQVETRSLTIRGGDIFLICSDGLNKMLSDSDLQACLEAPGGPEATCYRLIQQAVKQGGFDNITALVVEVDAV